MKQLLKKIRKKWQESTKEDKVYFVVITCFLISAVGALFVALAVYGWSLKDLIIDKRGTLIAILGFACMTTADFYLFKYWAMHDYISPQLITSGNNNNHKKTKIIMIIFTLLFLAYVIASFVLGIPVWQSEGK